MAIYITFLVLSPVTHEDLTNPCRRLTPDNLLDLGNAATAHIPKRFEVFGADAAELVHDDDAAIILGIDAPADLGFVKGLRNAAEHARCRNRLAAANKLSDSVVVVQELARDGFSAPGVAGNQDFHPTPAHARQHLGESHLYGREEGEVAEHEHILSAIDTRGPAKDLVFFLERLLNGLARRRPEHLQHLRDLIRHDEALTAVALGLDVVAEQRHLLLGRTHGLYRLNAITLVDLDAVNSQDFANEIGFNHRTLGLLNRALGNGLGVLFHDGFGIFDQIHLLDTGLSGFVYDGVFAPGRYSEKTLD